MIEKINKNVIKHQPKLLYSNNFKLKYMLLSDLHWDNPKCNRELLKSHLDLAVKEGAYILLNGDTFCLMQGKYDKRGNKSDIRAEHNGANYFDLIVDDALEFFAPYAQNILMVGYGNHETSIMKIHEFDILNRFVTLLNYKAGSNIQIGGYGGYFIIAPEVSNHKLPITNLRYHHGHGGGGVITKGVIQDSRLQMFIDAEVIWQGHVHELYHHVNKREVINHQYNVSLQNQHIIRTSTYKEEHNAGYMGYHVEKGRLPKPLGCYMMEVDLYREKGENRNWKKEIKFTAYAG